MNYVTENTDLGNSIYPGHRITEVNFGGGFGKGFFNNPNADVFYILEKKKIIKRFVKDYIKTSGTSGLVLGMSGGVDSSLVASLISDMNTNIYLVLLHESRDRDDYKRARDYAYALRKDYKNIIVMDEVDSFSYWANVSISIFSNNGRRHSLADANLRSRLRMVYLYYIANSHNSLVVGTGNYLEDNVLGFFTKYGDGAVDIAPIQRLMKSEVYLMAFMQMVPIEILEAQPNDGLWIDGRDDSDQIGMTYREVEALLESMKVDDNGSVGCEVVNNLDKLKVIIKRFEKNLHKIKPIPTPDMELKFKTMVNFNI